MKNRPGPRGEGPFPGERRQFGGTGCGLRRFLQAPLPQRPRVPEPGDWSLPLRGRKTKDSEQKPASCSCWWDADLVTGMFLGRPVTVTSRSAGGQSLPAPLTLLRDLTLRRGLHRWGLGGLCSEVWGFLKACAGCFLCLAEKIRKVWHFHWVASECVALVSAMLAQLRWPLIAMLASVTAIVAALSVCAHFHPSCCLLNQYGSPVGLVQGRAALPWQNG